MAQPRIGELVLDRYRLACQLCYGSIGTVFLAKEDGKDELLIVKWILHSRITSQEALVQLQAEVERLIRSDHAGIARPIEIGGEEDAHFLVCQYSHGFNLGQWFALEKEAGKQFSVELAIHIAIKVLEALHYAHTLTGSDGSALDIVHKDITPANILIDIDGNVRVSDFGIARVVSGGTAVTDRSMITKFAYLPPELVRNETPDARTDIYAVGLILLELLTGENPFAAGSLPATLTGIMTKSAPAADEGRSGLPAGLSDVIAKAVAKDIGDRYASAKDFADALEKVRTMSAEQASQQLAEAVAKDFRDPRIAELSDMPSLDERTQSSAAARPRMSEPRAQHKSQSNTWMIAALLLAAIIVAGAIVYLMSD